MKYVSYFNALLILGIFIILMGFFKYFFNNDIDLNKNDFVARYFSKQRYKNILLIPDTYFFIQNKKIYNVEDPYMLYLNKIFEFINEVIKFRVDVVTIDFINKFHISLMGYNEFSKIINDKLWLAILNYARNMNIKLNLIYNKDYLFPEFANFLDMILTKNETLNQKKYIMEVNFLIGYDIFDDIKKNIYELIDDAFDKKELISKKELLNNISARKIRKKIYLQCRPFDIVYACANSSLSESALLYFNHTKVINLNYSFDDLKASTIQILLKNTIFNDNMYFL